MLVRGANGFGIYPGLLDLKKGRFPTDYTDYTDFLGLYSEPDVGGAPRGDFLCRSDARVAILQASCKPEHNRDASVAPTSTPFCS